MTEEVTVVASVAQRSLDPGLRPVCTLSDDNKGENVVFRLSVYPSNSKLSYSNEATSVQYITITETSLKGSTNPHIGNNNMDDQQENVDLE